MRNVTFLIHAYNEELSIGRLINNLQNLYKNSRIIVIDNNCTDETASIASKYGAEVIYEEKQGKANAIKKGFDYLDSQYLVMLDADNTYNPKDASKLLEPLIKDEADVVLGSRLRGDLEKGAISRTNIIGNRILSFTANILYKPISDVCTGYWAFNKNVINYLVDIGIDSSGFEVEAEMFAKIWKADFRIKEIPISYNKREDKPKLNSFHDGIKIMRTLIRYKIKFNRILFVFEISMILIIIVFFYILTMLNQ